MHRPAKKCDDSNEQVQQLNTTDTDGGISKIG
jgi:hypothetical protein